jgi:CBS domain-containing protein
MEVQELMTRGVRTCRPEDTLHTAARIMWDGDLGSVIVTDFKERPVAVITDRDICMAAYTTSKPLGELQVRSAMSQVVHTCHRSDRVSSAERTMRIHCVRRLPVVNDERRLVGVLSLGDITRARMRLGASPSARRLLSDAAVTLGDICRPRGAVQPSLGYEQSVARDAQRRNQTSAGLGQAPRPGSSSAGRSSPNLPL